MARRKKQRTDTEAEPPQARAQEQAETSEPKESTTTAASGETSRKNSDLTDDERRALFFQHKRAYQEKLAAKKAADAALKNACKLAKAECGKDAVADIKDAIALEEKGGEAAFQADVERRLRVARWMGAKVGTQFSFADLEGAAQLDHFEEGKIAGLKGDPCKPPHDPSSPAYQKWMDGFHAGQAVLGSGFRDKLKRLDDDQGAQEPSDQVDLEEAIADTDMPPASDPPRMDTSGAPFHAPADDEPRVAGDPGPFPDDLRRVPASAQ